MKTVHDNGGYFLADLLVGLLLTAFLAQATMSVLSTNTSAHVQQDITANLEQNLRVGMRVMSDALRSTGYGVPSSNLKTWIPWVNGFESNPEIVAGPPATISVARCTPLPVAFLTLAAARGSTSLTVASNVPDSTVTTVLNNSSKRLIFIGGSEFAHVKHMSGQNTLTIDTSTIQGGEQGLSDSYPAGTPICRVDVLTFAINSTSKELTLDLNQGGGAQQLADQISNLKITTVEATARYVIEMTGLSKNTDPVTGAKLTRTLRSDVTLRNTL
jgi:hypothetical protein